MIEFDFILISILFGISGTLILFVAPLKSWVYRVQKRNEYLIISGSLGFLFLLNSFIYLLLEKMSWINYANIQTWWTYVLFLIFSIYLSLVMIEEMEWPPKIAVSAQNNFELVVFFAVAGFGGLILILNLDPLPLLNFFVFYFLIANKEKIRKSYRELAKRKRRYPR